MGGFVRFFRGRSHNSPFIQTIPCQNQIFHTPTARRRGLEGSWIFLTSPLEDCGNFENAYIAAYKLHFCGFHDIPKVMPEKSSNQLRHAAAV